MSGQISLPFGANFFLWNASIFSRIFTLVLRAIYSIFQTHFFFACFGCFLSRAFSTSDAPVFAPISHSEKCRFPIDFSAQFFPWNQPDFASIFPLDFSPLFNSKNHLFPCSEITPLSHPIFRSLADPLLRFFRLAPAPSIFAQPDFSLFRMHFCFLFFARNFARFIVDNFAEISPIFTIVFCSKICPIFPSIFKRIFWKSLFKFWGFFLKFFYSFFPLKLRTFSVCFGRIFPYFSQLYFSPVFCTPKSPFFFKKSRAFFCRSFLAKIPIFSGLAYR